MTVSPLLLLVAALQQGPAPEAVRVEPAQVRLEVGEARALTATVLDLEGRALEGHALRWRSGDPAVVSVDAEGRVTALRPGTTQVFAWVPGVIGTAEVRVAQLPAAQLSLEAPDGLLAPHLSLPLRVRARTRLGDEIAPPTLTFSSSDPEVAWVDPTGRVFGRRAGRVTVTAATPEGVQASLPLTVRAAPRSELRVEPHTATARSGDVLRFRVADDVYPGWGVSGSGAQIEAEGAEGVFVAEEPGTYVVTARIGEDLVSTARVEVRPREYESRLMRVGRGPISSHHSGDMWAFEGADGRDYVYVGTFMYDWMKAWDVTDPSNPVLTDSVQLDARRINDVKIHPNNRIGIVTREGASSRRNGIVLLDLADPAHPTVLSEYQETVTGGVHNVWIDGETDLVYAVHNGTSDMHILDISDPAAVREVGRWGLDKEDKSLHDVIVQEGYAYLSYWDDGLIILDVGAGTHGGSPAAPAFVSQYRYPVGNTHVAWRHGDYVFVGDEIFPDDWNPERPIEARGYIHVVDVSDIERPVEVAQYEVPEAGVHNVWAEGDRLYLGYYQAGLRVLDISGELRGDLYRQGREVARFIPIDEQMVVPNWPMTWGAQLFKGNIYSSDLNSGIWVTRLEERPVVF